MVQTEHFWEQRGNINNYSETKDILVKLEFVVILLCVSSNS